MSALAGSRTRAMRSSTRKRLRHSPLSARPRWTPSRSLCPAESEPPSKPQRRLHWSGTARKERPQEVEDVLRAERAVGVEVRAEVGCEPCGQEVEDVLHRQAALAVEVRFAAGVWLSPGTLQAKAPATNRPPDCSQAKLEIVMAQVEPRQHAPAGGIGGGSNWQGFVGSQMAMPSTGREPGGTSKTWK